MLGVIASHYVEAAAPTTPAWVDAVLGLSPSAFYRFNETSGTVAADSSGNARNATYSGAPTFGAASLVYSDPTDRAVTLDTTAKFVTGPAPVGTGTSVMFVYKGTGGGTGFKTMFGQPSAISANRCGLYISPGVLAIQYKGVTNSSTYTTFDAAKITDDLPHLIVVTFADGIQKVYVDGAFAGSTTIAGIAALTDNITFGQFSSSHACYGTYDDGVVFPTILTAAQVSDLYKAFLGNTPPPPVVTDTAWDAATMLGADGLHPNNRGMTYLAKVYKEALADAGKTPAAGSTVYAYGDSWTASDYENTPTLRAIVQFTNDLGLKLTNQAISGFKCGDVAARAIGTAGTYNPGASNLVVVHVGVNNLQVADTTLHRDAIASHMRGVLSVLVAAERIEQTAFTFTGTWLSFTNAGASGGSNHYTSPEGNTATYNITTPGDYYLLTLGTDSGTTAGRLIVTQGATQVADVLLNRQHTNTGKDPVNSGYGPKAARLNGLVAGPLTVTHNRNGELAGVDVKGYLDALVRVSSTPPTILLVKPVYVTKSTYQNNTLLTYMRDLCDTLAAEFGSNVVVADPA